MKTTFLFAIYLVFLFPCIAQNIVFESPEKLFEHPADYPGFYYPAFPFDKGSDGITDFLVGTNSGLQLYNFSNDGDYEISYFTGGYNNSILTSLDFDEDGNIDFVLGESIQLFDESTNGFKPVSLDIDGTIVGVGDFDKNNFKDLLILESFTNELSLYYNNGDNTFTPELIYEGVRMGDLDIGDIDLDGNLDIVIAIDFEDFPGVILYNRIDSFESSKLPHQISNDKTTMILEDIDVDGDLDILLQGAFGDIYILINTDNSYSEEDIIQITADRLIYFSLADMDNDGDKDILAVLGKFTQEFSVILLENDKLSFESMVPISKLTGTSSYGIPDEGYFKTNLIAYDYNNNGLKDLIYTDGFNDPPNVYLVKNSSQILSSSPLENETKLVLTPNPVIDILYIENIQIENDQFIEIFTSQGQLVKTSKIDRNINVSSLPSGIYYFRIKNKGITKKFVKI